MTILLTILATLLSLLLILNGIFFFLAVRSYAENTAYLSALANDILPAIQQTFIETQELVTYKRNKLGLGTSEEIID